MTSTPLQSWDSSAFSDDRCADLRRLLDDATRSSHELRHCAERAQQENDPELARFFERCAASDTMRTAEAKRLLSSRTKHDSEAPTSAAFAAGDGADDVDVSPDSRRGRVGVWPAL